MPTNGPQLTPDIAAELKGLPKLPDLSSLKNLGDMRNVGPFMGLAGGGGKSDPSKVDTPTNNVQEILNTLKGYNYGQLDTAAGASPIAAQLAKEISALPSDQAQQVLKQIQGTTLGTDVSNIFNPPAKASQNYGFDPLSLGAMFQQTMAPWLAGQQAINNQEQGALAKQMQGALHGASPEMQQVLSTLIPSQEAAQGTLNEALTANIATAPEQSQLIQALTQATQAAKLAQTTAQSEPYWAATTGVGALPGAAPGTAAGNAQSALAAIAAQASQSSTPYG